jgi:diguanylate cyclase (GGDEF)-like protein
MQVGLHDGKPAYDHFYFVCDRCLPRMNGNWTFKSRACLLACVFLADGALAQVVRPMLFERLGLDEGLSQLAANAIAQDAAGFIWIGTEEGLDRYDGYGFRNFRHDRSVPHSLTNNFIGDIEVDPHGGVWIATDGGGVVRAYPASGAFAAHMQGAAGLERVRALSFDSGGRMWIASWAAGVARYDMDSRRLTRYRHDPFNERTLRDDSAYAILPDREKFVWVATETGLDRLEPGSGHFMRWNVGSRIRALLEDAHGAIWAGGVAGLARLKPGSREVHWFRHDGGRPDSLPAGEINALLEDRYGRLWIGTDTGLALFNRESGTFTTYTHNPADPRSLPDNQVMSLREDRGGLLWIGTKFGGVAKWNPRTWSFGHHPAGNVIALTEDRARRLWVGGIGGGLVIYDRRTGSSVPVAGLSDERVMALMTDRHGKVWAGTMGGGLNRIDPDTLKVTIFRHEPGNPESLGAAGVMSLLEDSSGRVWVGTYGGGLSLYEHATGRFRRFAAEANDPTKLESGRVTALAEDRQRVIWVGTDGGGVHLLDVRRDRFIRLPHEANNLNALSSDTVYAIHVDRAGTVWIGTRGGGLDRVIGSSRRPEAIRFQNFSERNGLPNGTVYGIRSDSKGLLWLSTNRGLARFDPVSGTVRAFHRDHGLQGEEFNFGAHYGTAPGRLFFGGPQGYNEFDPQGLELNQNAPAVVLAGVLRMGRPHHGPLELDARNSAVTFEFSALDFASPRANLFQYRLEGLDDGWTTVTHNRSVSYTNLNGGHYKLHVRAANADGVWTRTPLTIPFYVTPPPWKSPWAYAAYVLGALILCWLAWLAHRRSMQREIRYSQLLESEVRRRTMELEHVSLSDALTGLGNRRALIRAMPEIVARASHARFAFYVIDLDNLKPINDMHGHESGDRVLAGTAAMLREELREHDKVVRWGGDEFVLVKSTTGLDDAAAFVERLRGRIAGQRFGISGEETARTTCSIGFALYPFVAEEREFLTWEQVLNLADMALYRAKSKRNAWLGWSGRRAAAAAPDLIALLAADTDSVEEKNYVACRSSFEAYDTENSAEAAI